MAGIEPPGSCLVTLIRFAFRHADSPITRAAKTAPHVAAMIKTVSSFLVDDCCMELLMDGAAAGVD